MKILLFTLLLLNTDISYAKSGVPLLERVPRNENSCRDKIKVFEAAAIRKHYWPLYAVEFDVEDPVYIYAYTDGKRLLQLYVYRRADDYKLLTPGPARSWHKTSKNEEAKEFTCQQDGAEHLAYSISTFIGTI